MTDIRQDLLHRILTCEDTVLQYDRATGGLRTWSWPIDERSERVPMYDFNNYRASHEFHNPLCLCASLSNESAVYIATTGPYRGFWVAACAQDACGYFVALDNLYAREDIPTKYFPHQDNTIGKEPGSFTTPKGLKSVKLSRDVVVPKFHPPPNAAVSTTELINRLDTWLRPGITMQQFKELFAECECGLVVTRRMFDRHECIKENA